MNYANNNFVDYVNFLYLQITFKPAKGFAYKLCRVLPTLIWQICKDAGLELMILLTFWLVIMKLSQGRDLVVSLFEPQGIYGWKRIIFTVLAIISYSISMWVIPAFLFQQREDKTALTPKPVLPFNDHLFFAHRVLPLIPFWLVASTLFNGKAIIFVLAAILELYILFFITYQLKHRNILRTVSLILLILIAALWVYFYLNFQVQYTNVKIALALILYLTSSLAFLIYFLFDNQVIKSHTDRHSDKLSSVFRYRINTVLYFSCIFGHLSVLLLIYFLPFHLSIAPESILLYLFSLYVFVFDFFTYFILVSPKRQFAAILTSLIMLILLASSYWDINNNHHKLNLVQQDSIYQSFHRDDFESRYMDLKTKILDNKMTTPYPVILISGEGGGSRAALWFSQNLINFDYETNGKFRDNIFAISTVSGSSIGLSTVISFWNETTGLAKIDTNWLKLPEQIYANNFIGGSVRGLMLTDLVKSVVPGNWRFNRNTILQNEEAGKTATAIATIKSLIHPHEKVDTVMTMNNDLMSFFYENLDGKLTYRKNFPISFINTCRSNDGRRGIISSIKINDKYFNDAIDVSGYIYEDTIWSDGMTKRCPGIRKTISLSQACNMSELFPILSAPTYIDSLGSFVDGGYHENSGLKTTIDVYNQLKARFAKDSLEGRYKIYILYLKNGAGEKDIYKPLVGEPSFLQPLKALYNQPFSGSASYFEERAKYLSESDPNLIFLNQSLNSKYLADISKPGLNASKERQDLEKEILQDMTKEFRIKEDGTKDTILNFPLARWLSKTIISRMLVNAAPENRNNNINALIAEINMVNNVRAIQKSAFWKFPIIQDIITEANSKP